MRPTLPDDPLETRRLRLQAALDGEKDLASRNRLGQYATPPALALQLLGLGLRHLPDPEVRFLDPALGTGSFFSALLRCAHRPIRAACGVERDPDYASAARSLWEGTPLQLVEADFTRLPPSPRFNLLIANPPYVRHHHIPPAEKAPLVARSSALLQEKVSGLSGLYLHFVAHAWPWMSPGGVGIWLIPSEFMDTGYGAALRRWLTQRVQLLRIHRFDPKTSAFPDALVSSAVVLLQNRPPALDHRATFTFGGDLDAPALSAELPITQLRASSKWTRYPHEALRPSPTADLPRLGDLFRVQRGLATGQNRFFILSEERAQGLGLPADCLRPILPSPRALPGDEILADADGRPLQIPRHLLLDCRLPPARARTHPALWAYLQHGQGTVSEGYLCSRRDPWYAQERRDPAPILCTYMGRARDGRPPFRFLRNRSQAVCGNVYLGLHPRLPLSDATLDAVWRHLRALDPAILTREGRVYGGGLHKLEPRELMRVPLPPELHPLVIRTAVS